MLTCTVARLNCARHINVHAVPIRCPVACLTTTRVQVAVGSSRNRQTDLPCYAWRSSLRTIVLHLSSIVRCRDSKPAPAAVIASSPLSTFPTAQGIFNHSRSTKEPHVSQKGFLLPPSAFRQSTLAYLHASLTAQNMQNAATCTYMGFDAPRAGRRHPIVRVKQIHTALSYTPSAAVKPFTASSVLPVIYNAAAYTYSPVKIQQQN